jgi:hypothetical protein
MNGKNYKVDDYQSDYIDIDGTVEAIRAAWKCVPDVGLSELLDLVTPMPFVELSSSELIEELNNFTHQNQ